MTTRFHTYTCARENHSSNLIDECGIVWSRGHRCNRRNCTAKTCKCPVCTCDDSLIRRLKSTFNATDLHG